MLEVRELSAGYDAVPVLRNITFKLDPAEVVALLGRNGAGKTTLLKAISGQLSATHGDVVLAGNTITNLAANRIARHGLAYVPQGRGIFQKMTVHENLVIGTRAQNAARAAIPQQVFEYFPILSERHSQLAGTLSGGQQQQLAIARALCGNPKVMLLDEPSEGVQPNIVLQIRDLLRRVAAESGVSILLVEQNLELGLGAADRCLIMEKGQIVQQGVPGDFRDGEVLRRHLAI